MAQSSKAPAVTGEWECSECGYTEEGTETVRPPKCPECDAPADALEFYTYEDEDWEEGDEEGFEDEDLDLEEDDEDFEDEDEDDDDEDPDDDF